MTGLGTPNAAVLLPDLVSAVHGLDDCNGSALDRRFRSSALPHIV